MPASFAYLSPIYQVGKDIADYPRNILREQSEYLYVARIGRHTSAKRRSDQDHPAETVAARKKDRELAEWLHRQSQRPRRSTRLTQPGLKNPGLFRTLRSL